ncbi:cell division protein FtsW [Treponema parvum]|uniref:Probable peptidoglycan glycosyltransferase FtsW n=1 Tax=Treponema parvum TaxID=138851 RepID=A0A975ICR5_9SPIR|nr:putative peptidoglycan glycosyltransferase FtsW [Treponema parvum]QTQ12072.1 cell division protein FtsW [Treponema parvum]
MNTYNFFADRPVSGYRQADKVFIFFVILMWGIGIATLLVCAENSAQRIFGDPLYFVKRQLVSSMIGFVLFALFAVVNIKTIRSLLPLMVLGTLILCMLTFFPGIGIEKKGAVRWVRLPGVSTFQPSELVKFTVILFLANLFDKQAQIPDLTKRSVFPAVIGLIVFVGIVFLQKDFSTGFFIFAIGVVLFFVSGAKLSWLIPFSFLAVPMAFLMISLEPYRMNRLIAFLKPTEDLQGINYQSFASRRSINAGGFWGQGIGAGLSKLNGIPEIQTDYIFAGWTEATGFLGVLIYMLLLILFASRAYKIALSCKNRFAAIGAFGCATAIFVQSLLNCAVVGGVVPSTGITLPFFSSGGSSMMVTLAMCGFIVNASRTEFDTGLITENIHGVNDYE